MIIPQTNNTVDEIAESTANPAQFKRVQQTQLKKDSTETILPRRSVRKSLNELYSRNHQPSIQLKKSSEQQPTELRQDRGSVKQEKQHTKKTQFEFIYSSLMQLNEELKSISSRVENFDSRITLLQQRALETAEPIKKKVRKGQDLSKNCYKCPNRSCRKSYQTEESLNLHFKLKHCGSDFVDKLQNYLKSAQNNVNINKDKQAQEKSMKQMIQIEDKSG